MRVKSRNVGPMPTAIHLLEKYIRKMYEQSMVYLDFYVGKYASPDLLV